MKGTKNQKASEIPDIYNKNENYDKIEGEQSVHNIKCFSCGNTGHRQEFCVKKQGQFRNQKSTFCGSLKNYVIREEISNLPYIELGIGKFVIKSLIDTGADVSLLKYDIFCKLPREKVRNFCKIGENDIVISGVTGDKVQIVGRADVEFCLEGKRLLIHVLIARNTSQSLILGSDTLSKENIVIDVSHKCVIFRNTVVPFSNYNNHIYTLAISKNVKIPEYSKWTIPVKILKNKAKDRDLLIQGIQEIEYFKNRPGLSISNCVLKMSHNFTKIFIDNNTDKPIF